MSLTLYTAPNSTASVTEAVLAEVGLAYDRIVVDIDAGATRTRRFVALNPHGRVPVLIDDGVAIWESAAITIYLGETSASPLWPTGAARGAAMGWIVWANVTLAEAGGRVAALLPPGNDGGVQPGSRDWIIPTARDPAALTRAQADVAAALQVLDTALGGRAFILGNYTLADTHLLGFVGWLAAMGIELPPMVAAWLARCGERPELAVLMDG